MLSTQLTDSTLPSFLEVTPSEPPRPTPPTPDVRCMSELAPGLVACDPEVETAGISAALTGRSAFLGALCRLEAPGGLMGTGVHLGAGYILTARHVADAWRPASAWQRWRGSSRRERFDAFRPGWAIVYTPARGSFAG